MSIWESIWNWLNGNKTVIGLVIMQIASWVPADLILLGFIPLKAALEWLGGLLTGVGAVHRLVKANTDPEPTR